VNDKQKSKVDADVQSTLCSRFIRRVHISWYESLSLNKANLAPYLNFGQVLGQYSNEYQHSDFLPYWLLTEIDKWLPGNLDWMPIVVELFKRANLFVEQLVLMSTWIFSLDFSEERANQRGISAGDDYIPDSSTRRTLVISHDHSQLNSDRPRPSSPSSTAASWDSHVTRHIEKEDTDL